MVQTQSDGSNGGAHDDVWELLPWYVNGTLQEAERAQVEAHLVHCELCNQELVQCRSTAESVRLADDDAWQPSAQHFSEVMAQIDRLPSREASTSASEKTTMDFLRRGFAWLQGAPSGARMAFAVQGALVVVLAAALVWPTESPSPDLYRTFSTGDSATASPADGVRLRVVFAEHITEKEMRALLNSVAATIVHGPSPRGVYTVSLTSLDTDSLDRQARDTALARFRSHADVRLAEPVVSPKTQ